MKEMTITIGSNISTKAYPYIITYVKDRLCLSFTSIGHIELENDGDGLELLFIVLMHRNCRYIATPATPSKGADWVVSESTSVRTLPRPLDEISPFEAQVTDGWLMFETRKLWQLRSRDQLLALGCHHNKVHLIYPEGAVSLTLSINDAYPEFVRLVQGVGDARHYTTRKPDEYDDLLPVERCHVTDIKVKETDPVDFLIKTQPKHYHRFGPKMPTSVPRRRIAFPGP